MYIVYHNESVGYTSHLLTIYCIQFNEGSVEEGCNGEQIGQSGKNVK